MVFGPNFREQAPPDVSHRKGKPQTKPEGWGTLLGKPDRNSAGRVAIGQRRSPWRAQRRGQLPVLIRGDGPVPSVGMIKQFEIWLHAVPANSRKMTGWRVSWSARLHVRNVLTVVYYAKVDHSPPACSPSGVVVDTATRPQVFPWSCHHHECGLEKQKLQGTWQKCHWREVKVSHCHGKKNLDSGIFLF